VAISGDLLFAGYHYNYEDASLPGARKGLEALRALDAEVFVPGHGAVGGPELMERQAEYHDAVEQIVYDAASEASDDAALADALRGRFPNYRLGIVLPTAIARIKAQATRSPAPP
jgi:cyclase